jgi:hypothetical protein
MGFFDRLKNAWSIFVLSWKYAGKDKSLITIPTLLVLLNLAFFAAMILTFIFVIMAPTEATGQTANIAGSSIFLIFAAYLLFSLFINTFLGAAQSWMVYEVTLGKDTTVWSGFGRAWKNLGDIIWFSIVMFIIKILTSKRGGKGIGAALMAIFGGLIETLVRLAGKLVLPAMIVTERSFKEAVIDLKNSSKTWPEMLAFEVGVGPLFSLAWFIWILLMVFTGFVVWSIGLQTLTIILLVFMFVFFIVLTSIARNFINSTFYTLLYLALVEKKKIPELKNLYAPKGYWL